MSTSDEWTISFTFKAEDPDAAGLLREALHTIAENFHGITDVYVTATMPDYIGWANLSYEPGAAQFIDLRGVR